MNLVGTIEECRLKVMYDIESLLKAVHSHTSSSILTVEEGILVLASLRQEIYEDLNQIQHEYTNIRALEWLIAYDVSNADLTWRWNPRSMGGADEPDLRGQSGEHVLISAEVTTSSAPKGTIDQRMAKTLAKLSRMDGKLYYFVTSTLMAARARTKVAGAAYPINVIDLSEGRGVATALSTVVP